MALNLGTIIYNLAFNTQNLNAATSAANRLRNVLIGVASFETARRMTLLADRYRVLQARIQGATRATGDYLGVSRQLDLISLRTGTAISANVSLFQSLARVGPEIGVGNDQVLRLTETINQLGVIGGSSMEQMNNGILQFTQGMAAGIFRAEEWNSVVENMPEVAARIARGMGKTIGQMRRAILAGEVSSREVFDSLEKQIEEIRKEYENMPVSFARGANALFGVLSAKWGQFFETEFGGEKMMEAAEAIDEKVDIVSAKLRRVAQDQILALEDKRKELRAQMQIIADDLQNEGFVFSADLIKKKQNELQNLLDKETEYYEQQQAIKAKLAKDLKDIEEGRVSQTLGVEGYISEKEKKAAELAELEKQKFIQTKQAQMNAAIGMQRKMYRALREEKGDPPLSIGEYSEAEQERRRAYRADLNSLSDRLMTERELIEEHYQTSLDRLARAEEAKIHSIIPYQELRERVEQEHQDRLAQIEKTKADERKRMNEKVFGETLSILGRKSKEFFAINKAYNLAVALMEAPKAILSAYKHGTEIGGPFLGAVAAGLATAATAVQINEIRSASYAGRATGGSVFPNSMYRVNERGMEMLSTGGRDYLLTGKRGGRVTANSGMAAAPKIEVHIHNMPGQTARVQTHATSEGTRLDIFVEQIDNAMASGIEEGSSETSRALERRYGLNRAVGGLT